VVAGSSDIDEYDLVDPVDILTPLSKSSFWDGVVSTRLLGRISSH
jgi:cytoskeleton-associated protein 5